MDRIVPMEDLAGDTDGLTFGQAIMALKEGHRVTREAWDRGTFIYMYPKSTLYGPLKAFIGIVFEPYGDIIPWTASQTDMLTEDWRLAE